MRSRSHHHIGHIMFMFGAFLLLIGATIIVPVSNGSTKAFGVSDIIRLSNAAREQLDRKPLATNSSLMSAAQMKAEDMAKQHYFSHTAPDGTVAWDYFKKASYKYDVAGENLAITNESADAVVNGWLNSTTHRDNLLSGQYKDFGIGMAFFGDYQGHSNTYVIVALYGSPAATQDLSATTNPAGTSAILKPRMPNIPPALLAAIGLSFIVVGGFLEFRHIRHLHNSKQFA